MNVYSIVCETISNYLPQWKMIKYGLFNCEAYNTYKKYSIKNDHKESLIILNLTCLKIIIKNDSKYLRVWKLLI